MKLLTEIRIDADMLSMAFGITKKRIIELFRSNGRMTSYILAPRIGADLGYRELKEENAPACLIGKDGGLYLVRTVTKNSGLNFAPQYMRGAGRHFDHGEFINHIGKYAGYISVDATDFPLIMVYKIDASEIIEMDDNEELRDGSITYATFNHKANGGYGCLV